MKRILVILASLAVLLAGAALAEDAAYTGYVPLDPDPAEAIVFDGATVAWNGKTFTLDENTLFLDYRLDAAQIEGNPYAFNNVTDALAALKSGTAEKSMLLLTAPGVYWVDDPDADVIRDATNGPSFWGTPMGAHLVVDHLYFYGLSQNPRNVVYAVNRGQQMGAQGNFTMFAIEGVGLKSENVTFGNYCNVDLEFPLEPSLSRARRGDAITQAQLFFYTGGDGVAINTHFISRLNLSQFAKYFYKCHLESGGHAGGGYYVDCTFKFTNINFGGANMFNCDVTFDPYDHVWTGRKALEFNILDGSGNGLIMADVRFHRGENLLNNDISMDITWDNAPQTFTTRAYQLNVTLDGEPYTLQEHLPPGASVVVEEDSLLAKAFRVATADGVVYNLPNITGEDPFGYETAIRAAAVADGLAEDAYLNLPTKINASLDVNLIRSGSNDATLTYALANHAEAGGTWEIVTADPEMAGYVAITDNGDGTATIKGTNDTEYDVELIIEVRHSSGLEAAVKLAVEPSYVEAPAFTSGPALTAPVNGVVTLDYAMELGHEERVEQSVINWYRVKDAAGAEPFAVSVSRLDVPEKEYVLSPGDVGYYLMATIQPKHSRSDLGETTTVISAEPVKAEDVVFTGLVTDFMNLPTDDQHALIPGTWSLDGYAPAECVKKPFTASESGNWAVVEGKSGALGHTGLVHAAQGARIFYTPVGETFGDMTVKASFAPYKEAGQGFGSANNQFLDVFIKFDRQTMTGYAFRIERLNTADIESLVGVSGSGAGVACAVSLVEWKDGVATHITDRVMTSAFLAVSTVELKAENGLLVGTITSTVDGARGGDAHGYAREVTLSAPYIENGLGGTGAINTGTSNPYMGTNCNYTMFLSWETTWGE